MIGDNAVRAGLDVEIHHVPVRHRINVGDGSRKPPARLEERCPIDGSWYVRTWAERAVSVGDVPVVGGAEGSHDQRGIVFAVDRHALALAQLRVDVREQLRVRHSFAHVDDHIQHDVVVVEVLVNRVEDFLTVLFFRGLGLHVELNQCQLFVDLGEGVHALEILLERQRHSRRERGVVVIDHHSRRIRQEKGKADGAVGQDDHVWLEGIRAAQQRELRHLERVRIVPDHVERSRVRSIGPVLGGQPRSARHRQYHRDGKQWQFLDHALFSFVPDACAVLGSPQDRRRIRSSGPFKPRADA